MILKLWQTNTVGIYYVTFVKFLIFEVIFIISFFLYLFLMKTKISTQKMIVLIHFSLYQFYHFYQSQFTGKTVKIIYQ